ncbi:MAG TPA: hypothetical protein VGL81_22195 [Polyangiaceae bacterium]
MNGWGGTTCRSCSEANCGSPIRAVESGCSDYFAFICPGGTFDPNSQACEGAGQIGTSSSGG